MITKLPSHHRSPLRREINRELMIAWINRDLAGRAFHDIRKSVAFYDEDGLFKFAVGSVPDEDTLALYEATGARYYSKGI